MARTKQQIAPPASQGGTAMQQLSTQVISDFPAEAQAIEDRRGAYGITQGNLAAIALSGGGIRSATFSLGILRALSSLHLIHKLDYLSTVSGGGYAGTFYCGLFAPRGTRTKAIVDPTGDRDLLGQGPAQSALRYLRQSGRYLTPSGARDYLFTLALVFRNWMALTLVTGMALLLAALVSDGVRAFLAARLDWYPPILWISPFALLLPFLGLLVIGSGWAYWLTVNDVSRPWFRPPLVGTFLIFVSAYLLAFGRGAPLWPDETPARGFAVLAALALSAFLTWVTAWAWERWESRNEAAGLQASREDRIRHKVTIWQARWAEAILYTLLVAMADSLSFWLVEGVQRFSLAMPALSVAAVPFARRLAKFLSALKPGPSGAAGSPSKPSLATRLGPYLAWIAALILGLGALIFWQGLGHWISWHDLPGYPAPQTAMADVALSPGHAPRLSNQFVPALVACALFVVLASMTQGFVNLSSLATFYAGRLRRAYLGASNPERIGIAPESAAPAVSKPSFWGREARPEQAVCGPKAVNDSDPADDLSLQKYYDCARSGAPVHLINVTINETRGSGPATVQRDRHGLNMVLSPDGFTYSETAGEPAITKPLGHGETASRSLLQGSAASANKSGNTAQSPGQSLPVSSWVGISGAAFTTGLGSRTSLANSLLAFLANVRLGYWWKADRDRRGSAPSYLNLFRELRADFPGPSAAQWYLSDGGHFENTGVYELIRRKVPFIIASDNGCDPHYGFEDLANLVRKSRIDFGAEIEFLSADRLKPYIADPGLQELFAAPKEFGTKDAEPTAIAMLGKITYQESHKGAGDGAYGTLLIIKPRLTQDGPADLMRYFSDNPDFPQQTTLDQMFDEAQWESYYELGRLITTKLFELRPGTAWQPNQLMNLWP